MLQKINKQSDLNRRPIQILHPGLSYSDADTGIGSIGRIDYANISGNHTIAMHPHINDEILSYFRLGKVEHRDSEGNVELMDKNRMMLMKAGKYFEHEERMIDEGESLEGLQIFIRPRRKDLKAIVSFIDLDEVHSTDEWRLLASPGEKSPFQFSSQTWIYDVKLSKKNKISMPKLEKSDLTKLLYVFQGTAEVNNNISLSKKDSLIAKNESLEIKAIETTELVLFVTDEDAEIYKDGMFSGNKKPAYNNVYSS
ncbi:Pirin domain protein [Croceitalea dokdonensis DOKDO 023]|uniref:Pirin domain protein n=1 Tax=Croceitalea dokdonensis DOKDO 023 TaxID=1300341 RepID=A0A0P7A1D8_9FLAO|nr:pirin family protein [Croceitalea dokdonensis]KPM30217.1 Pirin domain protein [Croceitalea dokdonensis DOKDO 023]